MTFGETIRHRRHERGWSQFDLALETGGIVKPKEISVYEAGTVKPRLDKVEALCEALDIDLAWDAVTRSRVGATRRYTTLGDLHVHLAAAM